MSLDDFRSKQESIQPIFCEGNRPFWVLVRRIAIEMIRMIDRAYGLETFKK